MAKKSYFMKKIDLLVKIMFLFSKLDQKMPKNDPIGLIFFSLKNMFHGEEKLFYEKNRFVSQKMTLFCKLHQKLSKKVKRSYQIKKCHF